MGKKSDSKQSKGGTCSEAANATTTVKGCNHVKGRHILCAKLSRIQEVHEELLSGFGHNYNYATDGGKGIKQFSALAEKYSECSSAKKGGDLGWFPRGKMVPEFQQVAFNLPKGGLSAPFKTCHGYHIVLVEDRKT
eukprot:GHVS01084102.1.p1 GENE.GHVS01084102.1~~GHVS01084102.1.p1  ORF type:complete len:136 (+),score=11.13 GHVS01084102.1:88-495(+)